MWEGFDLLRMAFVRRILWDTLCYVELLLSTVVHAVYALHLFFSAMWIDLMNAAFTSTAPRLISSRIAPVIEPAEGLEKKANFYRVDSEATDHDLSLAGAFLEDHQKAPIVLVHGIFGFGKEKMGSLSYWGGVEKRDDRILAPDLGPLSSIYDRARELFYYLKGGTVDYGAERSQMFNHSRFGHIYHQGHYPEWDSNHPIHIVGHSTGAQVARLLQRMLDDKAFPGYENTSADWVLSITSLSGALNGTTRVYLDGILPEDGKSMKKFSLLQVLRVAVLVYEWLDIPLLKKYYDFGFDHYNLQWHKAGIRGLIDTLLDRRGPFVDANWVLPDLSIQSSVELNRKLKTYDRTYYFSYATKGTKKVFSQTLPASFLGVHPLLFIRALQMALWRHPQELPPPCEHYRDEAWYDNDGALNTVSQWYPRFPSEHPNCELGTEFKDGQVLQPGIWYYTTLEADHIYFIINRERAGVHFDVLYDNIFQRCRKQMRTSPKASKVKSICICEDECTCNGDDLTGES